MQSLTAFFVKARDNIFFLSTQTVAQSGFPFDTIRARPEQRRKHPME